MQGGNGGNPGLRNKGSGEIAAYYSGGRARPFL